MLGCTGTEGDAGLSAVATAGPWAGTEPGMTGTTTGGLFAASSRNFFTDADVSSAWRAVSTSTGAGVARRAAVWSSGMKNQIPTARPIKGIAHLPALLSRVRGGLPADTSPAASTWSSETVPSGSARSSGSIGGRLANGSFAIAYCPHFGSKALRLVIRTSVLPSLRSSFVATRSTTIILPLTW